ncbi:MAG: hypothetical protein H6835_15140 [Planctomycetes bacterium]|nr:hypothetical protein [Planctomycetota bacterium]
MVANEPAALPDHAFSPASSRLRARQDLADNDRMAGGTLNISLSSNLAEFVRERVSSGLYANASEVVREALRWHAACSGEPRKAPTLPDSQEQRLDREKARDAVARLRELRRRSQLRPDVTVTDLRDEHRR